MRNLKKILALALVFAMAFTFTASAAVDFTDKDEIGTKYVDDVNMLVELGVIAGYPDGSFGPQKNITRAEFAKMAYTIKYGSDTDGNLFAAQKSQFVDVEGNANVAWAKGYINYCANQKIVSGKGAGKFDPQGNITVAEVTKMLLVILGCDPIKEGFTGANWVSNVTAKAIDLGIYNGWTGDPSQLATRELVAKLMRNTIFSSVYTYSAITGAGSQMDALGQSWNQTLGEKTMGLQTVTGIVVANERYAVANDGEGKDISSLNIKATGEDSEESVILYESQNTKTQAYDYGTITIDRALDDDMLGAKVNVFFTADRIENNGRIDYKNIEVLGDVLVHSDTVAYTVSAVATDVYPNGKGTTSTAEIRPYIGFTVDGAEKKITLPNTVARAPKNTDAQFNKDLLAELGHYSYTLQVAAGKADLESDYAIDKDANFTSSMGENCLDIYRFVSVDGGLTYSYMFRFVDETAGNIDYVAVTAYSEAAGTIRIQGNKSYTLDLEDVVLVDEIAVDDLAVAYRANGKIYLEKVDELTAAVESFTDEGVMLNGEEYFAWGSCDEVSGYSSLFAYYNEEKGAMGANTKYYTFGNMIMEIDADEEVSATANYAVVLRSYYDADLDTAYVKLAFADNTEGTYKVGKLYTYSSSNLSNAKNNQAQELANNSLFGVVVDYKILSNGTVDLSGQDFKEAKSKLTLNRKVASGTKVVTKGKIDNYFSMNDATVVFALYGNPSLTAGDGQSVVVDSSIAGVKYAPVKAKAYKLADLESLTANALPNNYVSGFIPGQGFNLSREKLDKASVSYLVNNNTKTTRYIVAAAVTVGEKLANGGASYDVDANLAYVINARQFYNNETDLYYAQFTLVNETETITAYTVDDVQNDASISMLNEADGIGLLDGKNGKANWIGKFVRYELNSDGKISMLDNKIEADGDLNVKTKFTGAANSLYLVNVTGVRGSVLSFFDTDAAIADVEKESVDSAEYADDGVTIISVDENGYAGSNLAKIPARVKSLKANEGNAVIYLDEDGKIEYIFSFAEGTKA